MKVMKFGGTSIGTPDLFLKVAKIVSNRSEEEFTIVVLSAIGGITDKLLGAIDLAANGDKKYREILDEIKSIHYDFLYKAAAADNRQHVHDQTNKLLLELENKLKGVFLLKECSDRISDSIVTFGEYLSNNIMVGALKSLGKKCEFHDAKRLIRTNSNYGDAEVNFPITNHLLQEWFALLNKNHIPIVNGFTGSDENGHITTLGRSGSDFTATIIGGALNASLVEIWTDVDGVLSADPKVVPSAITLDWLSYNEASSLAVLGGKVIHPKTIAPVEKQNVPVSILNTFNPEVKGTFISSNNNVSDVHVKTITYLKGLSSISIFESESKYGQKILVRLFGIIARLEIPVVTISKSAYNQSISFFVQNEYEHLFLEEIRREFTLDIEKGFIGEILARSNLALITAIGIGSDFYSLVVRRIHDVLEKNGVKSLMFLDDLYSLNFSFIIDALEVNRTVIVLHDEFFGEYHYSKEVNKIVNVA